MQGLGAVVGNGHLVAAYLEQHGQAVGGVAVVVDQQDALRLQLGCDRTLGRQCGSWPGVLLVRGRQRQPQREGAALSRPGTGGRDGAAMQLNQ
ncbi:hypothetical protein D3C72_2114460 [compost metagenome]